MLIERCQEIASSQCIRFSFLSGDVHVCAAGRLYSDPKVITLPVVDAEAEEVKVIKAELGNSSTCFSFAL